MSSNLTLAARFIKLSVVSVLSAAAGNGDAFRTIGAPDPFALRKAAQSEIARNAPGAELPTPPASPFEAVRLLDPFKDTSRTDAKAKSSAPKAAAAKTNAAAVSALSAASASTRRTKPFDSVRLKDPFAIPKGTKADRQKGAELGKDGRPERISVIRGAELA